jgi:predicted nucleic acid-binding protein
MNLALDTSVVIAVLTNEQHKPALIELTRGATLIAPTSPPAEIGNAFSAMFRRKRISLEHALEAVRNFHRIPIRFSEIDLQQALELSNNLGIYAYDSYVIGSALKHRCALVTLDDGLAGAAGRAGVEIMEIS